ncbi:MAG: response regulator [Verrucomicrobiota bacterium]|nr:response regulator [Verrucomicrobiota bacterium]
MSASDHDSHARWLYQVLNSMRCGILATDRRGAVQMMTACARSMLGVTDEQGIGKPVASIVRLRDPDTGADLKIPTPRAFARKRTARSFDRAALVNRLGRKLLVDAVLSPIEAARRRIGGAVLVIQDVGAAAARDRIVLDRKMINAIGNLAGSMARDFGNYLGVISGHASDVADNLIPQTHAHKEALNILAACNNACDLTKRLLHLARASEAKDPSQTTEVDLAEIVGDAVSITSGAPSQAHVSFNIRHLDRMQVVRAEPSLLLDCLINLFQNAKEAMPQGGTIAIEVSETTGNGRRFLALRVSDTGFGIPREHLGRVFDPFFSTKKSSVALGLGLTLTKNAVEFWGGRVKVRSRPGRGATFTLLLPQARSKALKGAAPVPAGTETLLFADDNPETLAECVLALENEGYRVFAARNGDECVALHHQHSAGIHLSIVDAVMPGRSGKDVLQEILKQDPTAAVVVTSGFSRDYVRGALQVGAWSFIQKPFDAPQLLSLVRRALDQRAAEPETTTRKLRKESSP